MEQRALLELLRQVQNGERSPEEVLLALRREPYTELGYAKVDHHRQLRQGASEVIYGAGKTAEQIAGIAQAMQQAGTKTVLITRLSAEKAEALRARLTMPEESGGEVPCAEEVRAGLPLRYDAAARIGLLGALPEPDGIGTVVIATGGTSDLPVAEEAALTAEAMGNAVVRLYDVGVAGLHRLLDHLDDILQANVIVAVAGMEGALASVIGGLADCPVIAVPTSVGYGANFGGLSALLSMLNSCASGVSVVNIDNGFGAGYQASLINHTRAR